MFVDMFAVVISSFGRLGWAVGAVVDAAGGARQPARGRNGGLVAPGRGVAAFGAPHGPWSHRDRVVLPVRGVVLSGLFLRP